MENNKVTQLLEDVEKDLIAEIINDSYVLEDVVIKLEPRDFSNGDMSRIFGVILELTKNNKPVNENNIIDYINNHTEVQFNDYEIVIKALANKFVNSADVENHVDLIKNASIKRQLESFAGELPSTKIDIPNFNDQIEELEKRFLGIIHSKRSTKFLNIKEALNEYKDKIEKIATNTGELTGITSGFEEIDKLTNGFQKGDLIIIAARPGDGKTAIALNFLLKAAEKLHDQQQNIDNKKDVVVLFSLEMGVDQICQRLISCSSGIDANIIRKNKGNIDSVEWMSFQEAISGMSDLPILIDDSSDLTMNDIQSKVRQIEINSNIRLIIVDYLQLIKGSSKASSSSNRYQEVSEISRRLKQLARQHNVPVIAIAQLSRKIEERKSEDRLPKLSDLRESGSIEQDADIVSFLYINDDVRQQSSMNAQAPIEVEYLIAKHRNGPTGRAKLVFRKNIGQYTEINYQTTTSYEKQA